MWRHKAAIQMAPQGQSRVSSSREAQRLHGKGHCHVRGELDTSNSRGSGQTRIYGDSEVGTRAAGRLVSSDREVSCPGLREGIGAGTARAGCNFHPHVSARGDADDHPCPEPQQKKLGQENQQEGEASEVGDHEPRLEATGCKLEIQLCVRCLRDWMRRSL